MTKYIKQYDDIFTQEELQKILDLRYESSFRDGRLHDLLVWRNSEDPKWQEVLKLIESKITSYKNEYLSSFLNLAPTQLFEISHIGFLTDKDGSFTETHYDMEAVFFQNKPILKPLIMLLYLNEGYEGGQLLFPLEGYLTTPKAGSIVFFPAGFAFPHVAMPTVVGNKHVCRVTFKIDIEKLKVDVLEI